MKTVYDNGECSVWCQRFRIFWREFKTYCIVHVWREANQPTDFLANWVTTNEEYLFHPSDFLLELKEKILKDATQCKYSRM